MKVHILLLLIGLCTLGLTIAKKHRHRHRNRKYHFGTHRLAAVLLPTPTDDISSYESGDSSEPARGLKGVLNPLASLQKAHSVCTVEGAYGIRSQCSKYIECLGKGNVPSYRYCPSGKFFDKLKRYCINSGEATCKGVCKEEGQLYQDPINPKGFLKCMRGVPMPEICSNGQFYSVKNSTCSVSADIESGSDSAE